LSVPYADHESSSGGTIDRVRSGELNKAWRMLAAVASRFKDHRRAMVPETKGAAALVPLCRVTPPSGLRPVMDSPGARRPRVAIECAKFDAVIGRPEASHAATGTTQGCRVIDVLPNAPSFPVAATTITFLAAAKSSADSIP